MRDGLNPSFTLAEKSAIGPTTGLSAYSCETVVINPGSQGKVVSPGGSDPGFRYRLPVNAKQGLVRFIEAIPLKRLAHIGNGEPVAPQTELKEWWITLCSPDGTILHDRVPLCLFLVGPVSVGKQVRRRYFDRSNLIDFRQSFIECLTPGLSNRIVLRFTYA